MPASIFSETELARLASFPEEIPGDDLIRAFTLTGAGRDLGHLSPALYGHINPYGKYRFEIADRPADLRPLRSPENGP